MKITVIGGAGVRTVIFINGLLARYKKLNIDEVVLYDIDPEKLAIIEKLCRHVVARRGETLTVTAKYSPEEALTGADYVVTTLRVGGDHSRVIDEQTALQNGVIGQETTGVGGFSMAARTIPVLLEYSRLIEKYAPNAWIFNFTNPSGLVTQALKSAGCKKVIGICDAPSSTKFRICSYLGIPEEKLCMQFFGLNHLSWISSIAEDDGSKTGDERFSKELLPELINNREFLNSIQEFSMFDPDVFMDTGFLPNEYLYYYYHREKALENIIKSGATRGMNIEKINKDMFSSLRNTDIDTNPEDALQTFLYYMQVRENSYMSVETGGNGRPLIPKGQLEVPDGMGYAGVMLDCIEGLQSEVGRYLVLSVENKTTGGKCMNCLNEEDVIEVTCKVSKNGIEPVYVGDVPEYTELLIRNIKYYEKKSVEAILEGSEEKAVHALTLHPLINSYSLAKKLVKAYTEAYDGHFISHLQK